MRKFGGMKSMKMKLFVGFLVLSTLPIVLVIASGMATMVSYSLERAKTDGQQRASLVESRVSELFSRNMTALRTLAMNPMTKDFIEATSERRDPHMLLVLRQVDGVLADGNNTILATAEGEQILRSDGLPCLNISQRDFFSEVMRGREILSEAVRSQASGQLIVVMAQPVCREDGKVVGVVQRDYDISVLQDFVQQEALGQGAVFILDSKGKLIASSRQEIREEIDHAVALGFDLKTFLTTEENGSLEIKLGKDKLLASFAHDPITDWIVVTTTPYEEVTAWAYEEVVRLASLGALMILVMSIAAYIMAEQLTLPLRIMMKSAQEVAQGKEESTYELGIYGNDEVGRMAQMLHKVGSDRDQYRLESEQDKLTKLYNKAAMERLAQDKLMTLPTSAKAALYIIDLDHFKEANDTYGHQHGDLILQEFAARLRKKFRGEDYVGRFGGDEFVVLLTGEELGFSVVGRKAAQIQELAREIVIEGNHAGITASIGIASRPTDGNSYQELFKAADAALYKVKNNGRDGWCLSDGQVVHNWLQG